MAKARHRKPSAVRKNVQRTAVVTTGTALAAGSTLVLPTNAFAQPASAWDEIVRCESGNKNVENAGPSTASGYFQIIDGTWRGAGGTEFAPRAIDATFEEQAIVAQRIAERRGSLADWNASKSCWGEKINSEVPDGPAGAGPAPAPVQIEPAPGSTNTYTVVKGDTLVKIGHKVGKTWEELARLNKLTDPWTIFPGQVLTLEEPRVEYVVQPGDWLSTIALDLGITTEKIYQDNIDVIGPDPDRIFPGQVFFVGGLPLAKPPVTVTEEPVKIVAETSNQVVPGARLTSPFGPRGSGNHNGIDLAAPLGTPIYAAQSGRVITAEAKNNGFGQWVRVQGEDGTITVYGHIDSWTVNVGQWVEAGQQVATVGNRGQSTGPHLHLEIRVGPGPINPKPWLEARGFVV